MPSWLFGPAELVKQNNPSEGNDANYRVQQAAEHVKLKTLLYPAEAVETDNLISQPIW